MWCLLFYGVVGLISKYTRDEQIVMIIHFVQYNTIYYHNTTQPWTKTTLTFSVYKWSEVDYWRAVHGAFTTSCRMKQENLWANIIFKWTSCAGAMLIRSVRRGLNKETFPFAVTIVHMQPPTLFKTPDVTWFVWHSELLYYHFIPKRELSWPSLFMEWCVVQYTSNYILVVFPFPGF